MLRVTGSEALHWLGIPGHPEALRPLTNFAEFFVNVLLLQSPCPIVLHIVALLSSFFTQFQFWISIFFIPRQIFI